MSASNRSRLARTLAVLLGLSLPLSAQLTSPAFAKARPDLKVEAIKTGTATVERGAMLKVTDTTRNAGRAKAGRTTTRYYLSRDKSYGKSDRLLGARKVKALRPGAKDAGSTRLRVPAATPARSWYVVACADATRKVRESREGNNCRSTRAPIAVRAPEPPDGDPVFPMDPNPLTVDSTLQTDRAVTQMAYPHEPTTITATAADGTSYTLVVPEGALLGPESITMTPVASVPGLPLSGGLVGGVQIEPHGLLLQRPAQLTIDSPDAGPLAAQTAFLFHEDGTDFHQYPMDPPLPADDADTVRLSLSHFSTPGLGSGTAADRANLSERVPARPQAQLEAEISDLLRRERENQQNGGEPDPEVTAEVIDVMNAYHDDVIRAQMKAAETNEDLAAEAIAAGLGWSRQVQLLGDEDNPRHAEIMERVEKILRNVLNQNWADCQDHDLSSILDLLRVARHAALLGYAWQQEAQDKAFGCARFEIRFDSLITSTGSYSGTLQSGNHNGRWHTASTVTVPFLEVNSAGPLAFTEFSYSGSNTIHDSNPDCTSTTVGTTTTPGTLRATTVPLLASLNAFEGQGPPPGVAVQASTVIPGDAKPKETYQRTGCDGSVSSSDDSWWAGQFGQMRPSTLWTTDPGAQEADLIDTKVWSSTVTLDGDTDTELTTIELWHRPQA